jgi:hypothetical protein
MLTNESILRRRPDVRYRIVEDEAVIVKQEAGELVVVNETGASILELADGSRSVGEIVDAIVARYDVERETLEGDLLRFLADLDEAGVIETASAEDRAE